MDKDRGHCGYWNMKHNAACKKRDTHDVIHPMDLSFVFHFSWGSLSSQLHEFYSNTLQTPHAWAFWAVHPSIYKLPTMVHHDCTTTASIPQIFTVLFTIEVFARVRSLSTQRRQVKSPNPTPTSNDGISHGLCWGLPSLKPTVRTREWMVGILLLVSFFGKPYFQGLC